MGMVERLEKVGLEHCRVLLSDCACCTVAWEAEGTFAAVEYLVARLMPNVNHTSPNLVELLLAVQNFFLYSYTVVIIYKFFFET